MDLLVKKKPNQVSPSSGFQVLHLSYVACVCDRTVLGLVAEDGMQHLPDNLRQMLDLYDTSLYFTDYINKLTRGRGTVIVQLEL